MDSMLLTTWSPIGTAFTLATLTPEAQGPQSGNWAQAAKASSVHDQIRWRKVISFAQVYKMNQRLGYIETIFLINPNTTQN